MGTHAAAERATTQSNKTPQKLNIIVAVPKRVMVALLHADDRFKGTFELDTWPNCLVSPVSSLLQGNVSILVKNIELIRLLRGVPGGRTQMHCPAYFGSPQVHIDKSLTSPKQPEANNTVDFCLHILSHDVFNTMDLEVMEGVGLIGREAQVTRLTLNLQVHGNMYATIDTYVSKLAVIVFPYSLIEGTTLGPGILNPFLHAAGT